MPANKWHSRLSLFSSCDRLLLALVFVLASIGVVVLYSAAGESTHMLISRMVHLLMALALLLACSKIKPKYYEELAPYLYALGIILLLVVMVIGTSDNGAKRWLNLGFMRFQPSEILKLAVPMMLASYLSRSGRAPGLSQTLIAAAIIAVPFILVKKQPDLGTALMIASSGFWVLFVCGIRARYLLASAITVIAAAPIVWHFLHTYQKKRILTFLDPTHDPLGAGYHIIQSKIAIGSGGIWGKGFMAGTQAHLQFLPEHTTDFIFSVLSEEFGLMGCSLVIALFMAIFLRCIWLSSKTPNPFSRYLITAIAASFIFEGLINIGMVTGLLPVVGVPLPFISYGGSALLTLAAGFGIICSLQSNKTMW